MKKLLFALSLCALLAAGCDTGAAPEVGTVPDTRGPVVQPVPPPEKPVSLPVPEKPSLTFVQGARSYVQINWNYEIAKQFNVYRSTDPNSGWQVLFANFPSSGHTAVDSDYPKDSRLLYYRVTSVGNDGRESAPSPVASVEVGGGAVDTRPICPKLGPITPDCRAMYR